MPPSPPSVLACQHSRGRWHDEPGCALRAPFQRDRDRLLHAKSLRRLSHKTQVFLPDQGDHYRTRLTHTLAVAQITRSLARQLGLNEDLAEAIALAHDLGHPPFGHAGERGLQTALRDHGGFDHNRQSLRVVMALEQSYARFSGLNLCYETLQGVLKHNGPLTTEPDDAPLILPASEQAQLDWLLADATLFASLEAQIAGISDDIAYINHDLDDALRAGLISLDSLKQLDLTGPILARLHRQWPDLPAPRIIFELNRRLITLMIENVAEETGNRIEHYQITTAAQIPYAPVMLAGFSDDFNRQLEQLRHFQFTRIYRHPDILAVMNEAEHIVEQLAICYLDSSARLPDDWQQPHYNTSTTADHADPANEWPLARHVADFIAGMTDHYAIDDYRRLTAQTPRFARRTPFTERTQAPHNRK